MTTSNYEQVRDDTCYGKVKVGYDWMENEASKGYCLNTYNNYFLEMLEKDSNRYEMIDPNKPIKPYFDIDCKECENEFYRFSIEKYTENISLRFAEFFDVNFESKQVHDMTYKELKEHCKKKGLDVTNKNMEELLKLVSKSDCSTPDNAIDLVVLDASTNTKKSFHLIVNNYWIDYKDMKPFFDFIQQKNKDDFVDLPSYDNSVYKSRGQLFRMVNQSKKGKNNPFKLSSIHEMKDTLIQSYDENMKDDIKVKKVRSEFANFKLKPVVQYVEEDEEEDEDDWKGNDVMDLIGKLKPFGDRHRNEPWINFGYLCWNLLGNSGLEAWKLYSKRTSVVINGENSYNPLECDERWENTIVKVLRQKTSVRFIENLLEEQGDEIVKEDVPVRSLLCEKFLEEKEKDKKEEEKDKKEKEEDRLEKELVENFNSYNISRYVYHFYKENIYYSSKYKRWYELDNNNRWCERDEPIILHHQCYEIMTPPLKRRLDILWVKFRLLTDEGKEKESKECFKEIKETKRKLERSGDFTTRNNIVKDMKKLSLNEKILDLFNSKNNLLAFDNGVYDLDTMEFRETRPDDFITLTTGYNYTEDFDKDIQDKVLNTIAEMFSSKEDMDYILKVFASCLYGGNFNQEFYCLNGVGGNGKSVLSEAMKKVFGGYSTDIDIINFVKKQGNGTSDFPKGRHKRILFSSESEIGDKLQINTIKNITGDEVLTCREMYEKYVEYIPQFKPFLLTNEKPEFNGTDLAMKRRMRLVDFPFRFLHEYDTEYDINNPLIKPRNDESGDLLKKSRVELLHILLGYYKEMKDSGRRTIELSENFRVKTSDYCNEQNKLKVFIDDNFKHDESMVKKDIYNASILYNEYRNELECRNERNIISKKGFLEEMKRLGYESYSSHDVRVGYKLKKILIDEY